MFSLHPELQNFILLRNIFLYCYASNLLINMKCNEICKALKWDIPEMTPAKVYNLDWTTKFLQLKALSNLPSNGPSSLSQVQSSHYFAVETIVVIWGLPFTKMTNSRNVVAKGFFTSVLPLMDSHGFSARCLQKFNFKFKFKFNFKFKLERPLRSFSIYFPTGLFGDVFLN